MSGSGRETLPNDRVWSGGPPGSPGMVGRPSRISGSFWEALPDVREWSGDELGCLGVIERPSWMFGSGGTDSRMSGRGQNTICMSRRPFRLSGSGRESL